MKFRDGLVGILAGLTLGCSIEDPANQVTLREASALYNQVKHEREVTDVTGMTPSEGFMDTVLTRNIQNSDTIEDYIITSDNYKGIIDEMGDIISLNIGVNSTKDVSSYVPEAIGFGALVRSPEALEKLQDYSRTRKLLLERSKDYPEDRYFQSFQSYITEFHDLVLKTAVGTATKNDLEALQLEQKELIGLYEHEIKDRGFDPETLKVTTEAAIDFYKDRQAHVLVYDAARERLVLPTLEANSDSYFRALQESLDDVNNYFNK